MARGLQKGYVMINVNDAKVVSPLSPFYKTVVGFRTCLVLEGLASDDKISNQDFTELTARLVHVSKELQRLAIVECNRELSERERFMTDHLRTAAQVYAKSLGLTRISFCDDPRGHVVKVHLPSGRSNHWGGGTWAVLGS